MPNSKRAILLEINGKKPSEEWAYENIHFHGDYRYYCHIVVIRLTKGKEFQGRCLNKMSLPDSISCSRRGMWEKRKMIEKENFKKYMLYGLEAKTTFNKYLENEIIIILLSALLIYRHMVKHYISYFRVSAGFGLFDIRNKIKICQ